MNSTIPVNYFTVALPDSGTQNWVFLDNVNIQELFSEAKIWNRVRLKNNQNFENFDEMFYCAITRLKNTNLNVLIQYQHARIILRNENMGESLFKKYSKFQNVDEILYCGLTRLRNTILNYCGLC